MRAAIMLNPAAGGGRLRRDWPRITEALTARLGPVPVVETRRPGEGAALARSLAVGGAELVIAAGGDGTVSEVVDGLMRARTEGRAGAALGIIPAGTGDDFWRGLAGSREPAALAAGIAEGPGRSIDVGCVTLTDEQGGEQRRHFVNIASLGVSAETARAVNAAKRRGGGRGKGAFLWHAAVELMRSRFAEVAISVDGGAPMSERVALVAVANGRYFGGGMMIAPDAVADDGLLDLVVVRGRSKLSLLADLRLVYSGAHRRLDSCLFLRGRTIRVEPVGEAAAIEIDGESQGRLPATFEVLPQALTVRC